MDKLDITGLAVATKIGIHPWEQQILQRLLIDISIPVDISNCRNELANTIDYDQVCQQVTDYLKSKPFSLIETVAEEIAQLIKQEFYVSQLTVRVSKPHAIKNAANVSVTIHR
ncbi:MULTISPECIES: dihydroneopterin aldolase [Legionella]|uniref:7,8-dihydroneopterin aldolase n=1 Tax=Legionella septentrionalis TaxID=2498109 RepID=A0A433JMH6_9GAMM|nr:MULTISPECIES: dihydroneopterin aldolase [Legionella]MCP0913148.1 dihydroneopterin aldolase [Legionella sp. 27cVA30]RUQ91596.1 dihydroneopterin aldolase [Legionella septentrionalis]RUR02467.1 dihydroneopterin aldolase [Legionella septentrionalis]RUR10646.1 dihydroneopterin aldolase [Legionella septentrionalis]RUR17125.1 dihydroneopterin aldolase [Legionella septentrionalis]